MLPVRQVLLEGILGADLVSFNHFDYVRHFLNSCTRYDTVLVCATLSFWRYLLNLRILLWRTTRDVLEPSDMHLAPPLLMESN